MRVHFSEGKCGSFCNPVEAIDFLNSVDLLSILTEPDKLCMQNDGKALYLRIFDSITREYKARLSFIEKLFKWYSFPIRQLEFFDIDTITAMCNDYILNIKAKQVNIKIEDGEALTITSDKFNEVGDVELIQKLGKHGIERIFIDDYTTRIRIREAYKIKPFKGDEFGISLLISNSGTGFSAVRIQDFLLRYICSNGAYVSEPNGDQRYSHYNLFVQNVYDKVDQMLKEINERGVILEKQLRKMDEIIPSEQILLINKEIFRKTAIKVLNDVIESDRMLTKYELFNLITHRAKEFSQIHRILIEEVAGRMIYAAN